MQETYYTVPGCPLRLALVSDLHERPFDAVLASLERNRPELICVAGDFLYGRPSQTGLKVEEAGVLPFFSACAALAPCFASLGNHEWMITDDDLALIRETGTRRLVFDLSGLEFMDSSGVGLIIGRYKLMHRRGGSVAVYGYDARMDKVFRMSGLYRIVERLA